jgi:hypothetical protein
MVSVPWRIKGMPDLLICLAFPCGNLNLVQGVMDAVHWNESMGAYMDYGANSEDGILVQAVRPFTTTLPQSHQRT